MIRLFNLNILSKIQNIKFVIEQYFAPYISYYDWWLWLYEYSVFCKIFGWFLVATLLDRVDARLQLATRNLFLMPPNDRVTRGSIYIK